MASIVQLVREYAYVLLHKKMGIRKNYLTSSTIICRYGDTEDLLLIGGLAAIGEAPIAAGSGHCRRLINFVLKTARSSLLIPSSKGTKRSRACQNFAVYSGR